jgi:hypothetical protein
MVHRPPKDTVFVACVGVLILAVQVFSQRPTWSPSLGLGPPIVASGDEPHYLVLANSLILDGDLDLKNNYFAVHDGANQAGTIWSGTAIDHHSSWYVNGERRIWGELFNRAVHVWPRGPDGQRIPQLLPGYPQEIATGPEYSAHPIGIAVLLAPILYFFRGSNALESVAVFLAGLATVLAMLIFRRWLYRFTDDRHTVRLTVLAVFLASPVWYYSRGFFNEPFLVLAVIGAFALTLEDEGAFWGGAFLGAGMLMKPQLALVGVPLGLWLLSRRRWRDAALFAAVPVIAVAVLLYFNQKMYGTWSRGPYPFYRGDPWEGLEGLLKSEQHGLFRFWPVAAFAVIGWPGLLKKMKWEALFPFVGLALVLALTSWWKYWDGGICYGPRLLVPIVPLLGLGLVGALDAKWGKSFTARWFIYACLVLGILINGIGVTRYWIVLNLKPTQYLVPALFQ